MDTFDKFNLTKHLQNAIDDLGFEKPTPIQSLAFSLILSGRDVVGIAQTGTGKTLAYMLPLLQKLKFSKEINPCILLIVPTRELVLQMADEIRKFAKYMNVRVLGVYGGTNINTQKQAVAKGCDILVATPGRLYDLALSGVLQLKGIKKVVIDEVDIMLDIGFRFQLTNIMELLPKNRQNLMFSATMTEAVDTIIKDVFVTPAKISIAVSGTPLHNISQICYAVPNFYTKVNLLIYLLNHREEFNKVIVFVPGKKTADRLYEALESHFGTEMGVIHSNKAQNYRLRAVRQFDEGVNRILIATDVMARGIDLNKISHVINFDTPLYPENYMHRIGRSGRAEELGKSILFYTKREEQAKEDIETLMSYKIPIANFPEKVEISGQLTTEEKPQTEKNYNRSQKLETPTGGFHEKLEKNLKTSSTGSYKMRKAAKYKKPKTRGDKTYHKRQKRG